jgi:type II restriction enzyme
MALDLAHYDSLARQAAMDFWGNRGSAKIKQQENGKADQGERASVTSGKNMDGFLEMVTAIVRANGLEKAEIHRKKGVLTLPGYFRPTKLWDMLVINEGRLVAAIEFKSHVGPSFGNNFNNRTEEALGTATDFWTAYREGAFGKVAKPFVGWLMLLEDAPGSQSAVQEVSPHFPVFPEFKGASYAERYNVLCQRLMQEQLYTTASVLLSPREAEKTGGFTELSDMTGLRAFVATLAGHVAAEAARTSP